MIFLANKKENNQKNKFNIAMGSGFSFYLKKLSFDLGIEFPGFLFPSPSFIKCSVAYHFKKEKTKN